jgi:transglutaminase-like putative cysteine protease
MQARQTDRVTLFRGNSGSIIVMKNRSRFQPLAVVGFKKAAVLLIGVVIFTSSIFPTHAAERTVYSISDLKAAIYEEMTARSNAFSINYSGTGSKTFTSNAQAFVKSVYAGSDDYLEWNMDSIAYQYSQTANLLEIDFTAKYLTTKSQEDYVVKNVDKILQSILVPGMTDDEKLSVIHQYILDHVSYDETLTNYSAYAALAQGKAVCQGYSLLMDKMLEKAGIKTIIIDGSIPEGTHAWNLVQLGGVWYHVDATNDDTNSNKYYLKTDGFMRDNGYSWTASAFPKAQIDYVKPIKVTVFVDGQEISFDTQPYINPENRTMVPVRFVSEKLGAEVSWNNTERSVTVINNEDLIYMIIGNRTVLLNGVSSLMDTSAIIKDSRTMVPLRFISEYLGATVQWDAEQQIVHIYSPAYAAR